jgi:hypothetical protein
MKRSKEKLEQARQEKLSHGEKKQIAYWINQGIDLDQLNHVTGREVKRWK